MASVELSTVFPGIFNNLLHIVCHPHLFGFQVDYPDKLHCEEPPDHFSVCYAGVRHMTFSGRKHRTSAVKLYPPLLGR